MAGGPQDGSTNLPHRLRLTYLSRQPPDYLEQEFSSVTAGVRLMSGASTSAVTAELLNADEMMFVIPVDRVQAAVASDPVRFDRWGGPAITLGVRVR